MRYTSGILLHYPRSETSLSREHDAVISNWVKTFLDLTPHTVMFSLMNANLWDRHRHIILCYAGQGLDHIQVNKKDLAVPGWCRVMLVSVSPVCGRRSDWQHLNLLGIDVGVVELLLVTRNIEHHRCKINAFTKHQSLSSLPARNIYKLGSPPPSNRT